MSAQGVYQRAGMEAGSHNNPALARSMGVVSMKIFKVLLILILFPNPVFSAIPLTKLWEKSYKDGLSISPAIEFDSNDNVIVTGWVFGKGTHIIKYDSNGALVWDLDIGSSNWLGVDSAIDSADNIFFAGSNGTVGFVTKLLPDKTEVWTRTHVVSTISPNASVTVDSLDNCIVLDHGNDSNWILIKYDKHGTELFSVDAGNFSFPMDVVVDSQDNIIAVGYSPKISAMDMVIAKFDPSGAQVWDPIIHNYGDHDYAQGVCTDKNDNIYVTGSRRISSVPYMVLRKYDKDGNFIRDIYEAVIPSRGESVAIQDDARVIVGGSRDSSSQMYMAAYDLDCAVKYWDLSYDPTTGGIDEILALTTDPNGNIAVACNSAFSYLTIKYENNILLVPAAIADLGISSTGYSQVHLTWTAPGDDGNIGTAHSYDIRYSNADITPANWTSADAAQLALPLTPSLAGTFETALVITLDQGTTYYFAIKTEDNDGYISYLSNVVNTTTSGTPPTPTPGTPPTPTPGTPPTPTPGTPPTPTATVTNGGLANVHLAPNPYVKSKNLSNSVWFLGLPKFVKIKIFTLSGNIVKTIVHDDSGAGGSEEWDVGNISSGIYIYILSSATEIKKGKMTIIK